jgi:DNA-binding HxlR family transcriptional regulator
MVSYGQFCPIAKGSEVVAGRWTLLILRELMFGAHRYNDLQRGIPQISRTLLAQRLRELEEDGVISSVERASGRGREYSLTPAGHALQPVLAALSRWGQTWGQGRLSREDLDVTQLMWAMKGHADVMALPPDRLVTRFDFRGLPGGRRSTTSRWLVLARPDIDVCLKNPGFEPDLVISADLMVFTRVFLGYAGLKEAVQRGEVRVDGPAMLARRLAAVLRLGERPHLRRFYFADELRAAS